MDLEEILQDEEDFLLLMKYEWKEFVDTKMTKKERNPEKLFVNFKLKTKKKMISGKKSFYFQIKVNEEENKKKITLEDVRNNEEDFLLAMKEQWEEFIDTYM